MSGHGKVNTLIAPSKSSGQSMWDLGLTDKFFGETRTVLERFFELQALAMEDFASSGESARKEILQKVMHINRQVISSFLELQQSVLDGLNVTGHSRGGAAAGVNEVEQWLYSVIVDLTGCPADRVNSQSMLEDDLGLDSITMLEVYFKLADAFPQFEELDGELRDCKTVGDVLSLLGSKSSRALSESQNLASPERKVSPRQEVPSRGGGNEQSDMQDQWGHV